MEPNAPPVTVLIPARNEVARIATLVRSLKSLGFPVLVVDDGSTDDTAAKARGAEAEVLRRKEGGGKGAALNDGLARLRERPDAAAVVLLDGDGQHRPRDVETLLRAWRAEGADVVFGVRDLGRMPLARAAWTWAMSAWVFVATGRWLGDTQCGLRLLSRRALQALRLDETGYAVDTEIVLQALAAGLTLSQAPVRARASPKPARFLDDANRACRILRYAVPAALGPLWARSRRTLGFALFAILLLATLRHRAPLPRDSARAYAAEMEAALAWLKAHSKPGEVVMAHWFIGHQIATFADRPVIATTKVYPSEADETAARYRDIARFFLSEDEDVALRVAARYRASYVFADKSFQAYLCGVIAACEYATPNRRLLNRFGLAATVAGRLSQGGSFRHFQQVWDSPRFVIYRIDGPPSKLTAREQAGLLQAARRALREAVAGKALEASAVAADALPVAHVSLWKDGLLRGSGLASGRTPEERVLAAAREAARGLPLAPLRPDELPAMTIAVAVSHDDAAPVLPAGRTARGFRPLKAYRLRAGGRTGYVFPHLLLPYGIRTRGQLLVRLCSEAGAAPGCESSGTLETLSAEAFMEARPGVPEALEGPFAGSPELPTPRLLRQRAALAGDWLVRAQAPDGRLPFLHDPFTGKDLPFHGVREALSGEALVEAYRTFHDARYLAAARRVWGHLASFERSAKTGTRMTTAYLAFSSRLALSLYEETRDRIFLEDADRRLRAVWSRRSAKILGWKDEPTTYFALYAVTRHLAARRDPKMLAEVERRALRLRERFRARRILASGRQSVTMSSYLIDIFSGLYRLTGKRSHADAAFEVARWVADYQRAAGPPAWEGSILPSPRGGLPSVRSNGRASEGLLGAYEAARCLGREADARRYGTALDRAFLWSTRLQLEGAISSFLPAREASSARGAFRHDALNPEIWDDAVGHFLIPAARYLREQPPNGPRCPKPSHARKS